MDQFQVQTAGYSALYEGQGVQNYVVKSGTNQFHGALYEYFRNTALDTWGFFPPALIDPVAGRPVKPEEHQNEYGVALGGPFVKKKLFFFLNYDGFRYSRGPKPVYQTDPTSAQLKGDFSNITQVIHNATVPVDIYDPKTTNCVGNTCTRSQFNYHGVPNTINPAEFSNVALYLQKFLPPLTNQNATNNYLAGYKSGLSNWSTTNRLDWDLSPTHTMSIIGAFGRQSTVGVAAQTTAGRNVGPVPYNFGQEYAPKTAVWVFEDTYTFSQKVVNQFKFGFARYNGPTFNANRGGPYAAMAAGITGLPAGQASDAFPAVTFSGTDAPTNWAGEPASVSIGNSTTLLDNVQWVFGKHALTLGAQIGWLQYQNTPDTTGTSPLTIANSVSETGDYEAKSSTLTPTTGLAYASFLVGAVDNATLTQNAVVETGGRFRPISPYVQDDWKVSPRLTVNIGLRYDFYPAYREAHNKLSWFNPTLANPLVGTQGALEFAGSGTAACNCSTPVNNFYKNIGPRLGFAFQSDAKTVWRGSWGVIYTHGGGVGGSAISRTGTGTLGYTATPKPTSTNGIPPFYLDSGFPAYAAPPFVSASYGAGYTTLLKPLQSPQTVSYADPYYGGRAPQYINWTFGFQRQFTDNMTLTMTYVGSQGHFEETDGGNARGEWINQLEPRYLSLGGMLSNKATPANLAAAGVTAPYASFDPSQTIAQALKPFPQYNGMGDSYGFVANSSYHALQMTLMQRPSRGLTFMLNYTWSRSVDDGGTFRSGYAIPAAYSGNGKAWGADRIERSASTTNQPQHVVFTGVWALPFGRGGFGNDSAWVRALAGGFKLSGIVQMYSGSPLAITASTCGTNPSQGTCLPSYNSAFGIGAARINGSWGKGITAIDASTKYINADAFTQTPAYTFSNLSRTAPYGIYGPGNYDVDISLRRNFTIPHWESAHLLLEGDLYNLTNHTQFGGIGTTFGNSNFGQVSTQSNQSRDAQLAARFEF